MTREVALRTILHIYRVAQKLVYCVGMYFGNFSHAEFVENACNACLHVQCSTHNPVIQFFSRLTNRFKSDRPFEYERIF
jgi:hypothetical protein